ncbi:D-2-hydroxyacid dehydrogenase [Ferruginibacter sp. SUN002]|uniref:D-2-hydroxyacid dehydrogenase n=1 Tax=Ferruginibacter sp. SUN002 TaxID=2937789 RepID=UPI003D369D93
MKRTLLLLYKVSQQHLSNLQNIAPDWNIVHTTDKTVAAQLIENAEVVMGNHHLCESLPLNKQKIKWLQTNSVGIDYILKRCGTLLENIIVTNARGVYNDEICEHTIGLVLTLHRNLHLIRDAQHLHQWERPIQLPLLSQKNAMIIGYGSLGKVIGEKLSMFGTKIYGVNTEVQFFIDEKGTKKHWKEILPTIDIVILALPYTNETINYFSATEIQQLPANAILINIGRAGTIDEKALYEHLNTNKIHAAALDVFDDEPLNPEHTAWTIKNLFVSPHMARTRELKPPFQYEQFFEENFKRYINNESLQNIVDITKGY